jgi:hypothetical protein
MRGPVTGLSGKRVLVLSNHQILCEAIKVGLKHLKMRVVERQAVAEGLDLVVLTSLSSLNTSPAAPARELLPEALEAVPLLVISDHKPTPSPDADQVYHLGFPFRYPDLYAKTAEILGADPWAAEGGRR